LQPCRTVDHDLFFRADMSGRTTVWNTGVMIAPARGFGLWERKNPGYSAENARLFLEMN